MAKQCGDKILLSHHLDNTRNCEISIYGLNWITNYETEIRDEKVFNLKLYTHNSTQNEIRPISFMCDNTLNRDKVTVTIAKVKNNYFTDHLKELNLEPGVRILTRLDKNDKMYYVFDRDEYVIKVLKKKMWFNSVIKYKVTFQIELLENIYNC